MWSEAANGTYIFGGYDDSGRILGAVAGQRWRVPQPKDGRSCAEAAIWTTCTSLTARRRTASGWCWLTSSSKLDLVLTSEDEILVGADLHRIRIVPGFGFYVF